MLRSIIVSGEASNVKYHSSGHIYFTLKDKDAALACVMFRSYTRSLSIRIKEGMQIEVSGSISVYEKNGSFQLYATQVKSAGAGALYEKYEKLKAELEEMGMFSAEYKQAIPKYATRIGIVTAPTGAAVQDIMQIARRRNPYVQLILYPALVQGVGAKESIVAGIHALENQDVDVIIVGRGGGSIEDLWAFNERCVAEAIFNCSVPIVSAVGHETDTTIADYVADMRAPTPSAAAELTVFSYEEFEKRLTELRFRLSNAQNRIITRKRHELSQKKLRMDALSPAAQIQIKRIKFLNYFNQFDAAIEKKIAADNSRVASYSDKLNVLMERKLSDSRNRRALYIEKLKALSPLFRLENGYASVTNEAGKKISDVSSVAKDDKIKLTMKNGYINARVENVTTVDWSE